MGTCVCQCHKSPSSWDPWEYKMKNHLRVTMFLAAAVTGLAALFFSPGTSSRALNYYRAALSTPASAAKRPRAARGISAVGQKDFDYAKTLNKSLKVDSPEPPRLSLKASDLQAPQQPKITPDVVPMVGPVSQDQDLRKLAYIPPKPEDEEEGPMRRHPLEQGVV